MASSPTPWTIRPHLPDAHFEVVADAKGNTVGTATRPDDAALIVEAVNEHVARHRMIDVETLDHVASERDRLRDLIRRVAPFVAEAEEAWRKVAATKPEDIAFTAEEDRAKLIRDAKKHHAEIVSALREVRETLGEDRP